MNDENFRKFIKDQTFISDEFLDGGYDFWFTDNEQQRSPFAKEIQEQLRKDSFRLFMEWVYELTQEEKKEMKDEDLREMFEIILFNEGMKLAVSDEEKLTITYPFMPRIGDMVNDEKMGKSKVKSRTIVKEDKNNMMMITLQTADGSAEWETKFELPA